jgi:hypothetical protein
MNAMRSYPAASKCRTPAAEAAWWSTATLAERLVLNIE